MLRCALHDNRRFPDFLSSSPISMEYLNLKALTASVVYSVLGIVILMLSFYVFNKLTPGTLRREILEEHNTALAIIAAAFMLAVAIIISAAIHG
jgi:uncharacterized membrane protein YjfL (UPF0719 family)